jgi:adenine-specific DNA methylase
LKDEGLLVFSYHHSREEGWQSLATALCRAGFAVVNSHPVKAEMSVATPKSQAKEPIQLDIILVCRKQSVSGTLPSATVQEALARAHAKILRLAGEGFTLSRNDRKVILCGQLLTAISTPSDIDILWESVATELDRPLETRTLRRGKSQQHLIFRE